MYYKSFIKLVKRKQNMDEIPFVKKFYNEFYENLANHFDSNNRSQSQSVGSTQDVPFLLRKIRPISSGRCFTRNYLQTWKLCIGRRLPTKQREFSILRCVTHNLGILGFSSIQGSERHTRPSASQA